MPLIHGTFLSRQEFLRRVGEPGQAFGIRTLRYDMGRAESIRAHQVDLASGLQFTVNETKGMDLFSLSYRGIPFGFVSKAGLTSPALCDEQGMAYRNCLGAGFLYTAGLSNVGGACEEDGFYHYAHGSMKNIPAENVSARAEWAGDECDIALSGEMREAAFFGRNLLVRREIRARVGGTSLTLEDTIENLDFADAEIMLLYHLNLGYPVLDEGVELIAPVAAAEPLSEHTRGNDPCFSRMTAPIDANEEFLYALALNADERGLAAAGVYNRRLGLGMYVRYSADVLRYLIEWKCMRSGDYALGVLPSTCRPVGRIRGRADGELLALKPFAPICIRLEIGILDGESALEAFKDTQSSL